ncbi:unnamed protein product [Symbiodinium necroappetens]|uniref:Nose resistant to fluoxetine protein 6 n=1 Tax=Symbiodinium necroappetens TaxID=1628268 RepID=A0A813A495_9DINO|nr:unnamed protein product [Symbiodinium necroappetens]
MLRVLRRTFVLALQASSVLGNGNPDCWIEGYTYQLCCDITKGPKGEAACWDGRFSYETCCLQGIPQTEPALNEWNYQNHDFKGKESAVFRDRALFQGMSECQRRWGWDLNIQWGPPTGVYAEFSGIPLRHLAHGWDGQRHGDVGGCIAFHGRFFLIRLGFDSATGPAAIRTTSQVLHFGFCAPKVCSAKEVVNDLVPAYTLQITDAQRVAMTVRSVDAWEWPRLLESVHPEGEASSTLRDRMDDVSFQVLIFLAVVFLTLLSATVCDHFWLSDKCSLLVSDLAPFMNPAQIKTRTDRVASWDLRLSFCYRAVVAMTVLTLHLALGEPERQISFPEASKNCALKLVRKFARQFPLIVLSVWWDRTGSRYAFHARPLSYVDTTLSKLEGSTLIWTNEVMDGLECKSSFWSCTSRFFTINWQVRDATERILACFGFLLLQAAGLNYASALQSVLVLFGFAYYYFDYFHESLRRELNAGANHLLVKRLENPAFLGLFLLARSTVRFFPNGLMTQRVGLLAAGTGWLWSTWINREDYELWCQERNVKDVVGDVPFVLGLCILLRTERRVQSLSYCSAFTLLSRLSFCILVTENPLQTFLLEGYSSKGLPLVRSNRADPFWEQLLLGPGLLLAHLLCALLLYLMVQRPFAHLCQDTFTMASPFGTTLHSLSCVLSKPTSTEEKTDLVRFHPYSAFLIS